MGIKGIYGEIGHGQRVALTKLAIENFEKTGRSLRIAVDVSIWQFQIQSGKGGTNPALRTLYYRLLRFRSMAIQPLFVFDGPHKPPFKRNKHTGISGPSLTDFNTKQLLKYFGFPFHVAPGEAEAECALLQREGIVDAVLSEDVDTLMFGCDVTLRNWSSEGTRGSVAPTHVTIYDAKATKEGKSGLDREGMILVALMSGGDYITEGIPGCGIKVACEAARAGFGRSLCGLSRTDTAGLQKWKEHLIQELYTNKSKHFRVKHKALQIPEAFPNKEVLGYYTHPVVSSATKITKLRKEIEWDGDIDVVGLRNFVAEAFDWTHKNGAKKYIRGLAPALLVSKIQARANRSAPGSQDVEYNAKDELALVREICGRRNHFSTDGLLELRLVYHPATLVGLDLDTEADGSEDYGRNGLAPLGDYCSGDESDGNLRARPGVSTKRSATTYDPTELQKIWVPETIAKVGIPLTVQDYEEVMRNPRKLNKRRAADKGAAINCGMQKGAIDRYFTSTKSAVGALTHQCPNKLRSDTQTLLQEYLAPGLENLPPSHPLILSNSSQSEDVPKEKNTSKENGRLTSTTKTTKLKVGGQKESITASDPWSIAQMSSPTSQNPSSTVRISKPGVRCGQIPASIQSKRMAKEITDIRRDSTRSPLASPPLFRKHSPSHISTSHIAHTTNIAEGFHSPSPSKKRILNLPSMPPEPAKLVKEIDAAAQEVIDISSSPTPAFRLGLTPDNNSRISRVKAVQDPIEVGIEVNEKGKGKKFVMLRESLEGSWKEIGEEEGRPAIQRARGRVWRASAVEVLDMTGD